MQTVRMFVISIRRYIAMRNNNVVFSRHCRLKYILAQHFMTFILMFLYWLIEWAWLAKNVIGAITLCYNNIGNLLTSRDTTILVKIWQQTISKILRRHVSAINSHHQANNVISHCNIPSNRYDEHPHCLHNVASFLKCS